MKSGPHYVTASVCQYVTSGKLWHSYGPLLFSWTHPWALVHCRSSTIYLCRPPVLRNANDCQLQTAFKILTDVFHYKGRYLCHMLNCGKCMLRHLRLLLSGFGYLPKAYLNDDDMCKMYLAVLIDGCTKYLSSDIRKKMFIWWEHCSTDFKNMQWLISHIAISLYICVKISLECVIQGVKDSKIWFWLYSVMLLSCVSVRGGWLDSLVLDNCTLPRSVVPFSVSMWPRLQEPYLGCMSSSSCPVSSPSCLAHPHSAAGGR